MSIIHQALKKVHIDRDMDTSPAYIQERGGYTPFSRPAQKIKITCIVIALSLGIIAGFWVFLKFWPNASALLVRENHQSGLQAQLRPEEDRVGNKDASNNSINANVAYSESRIQTALEAAKNRNLIGMEIYRQGKFSLAKMEFLASIEAFPQYAEAYNNIGLTYKQLGDFKNAEESYKKALQCKPGYPEALNNYGVLLDSSIGNPNMAREYFKKSISLAPDYPDPYLNMAISFEKDKKIDDAIIYYEKFLSHAQQVVEPVAHDIRKRILYLSLQR
ncbi:MAG: tetratricopeptide repeat protein [Deltaproteobacteria bacterium]|nr:tetratricopeptide repeat protein [Deltaproteobacteria bacterium]